MSIQPVSASQTLWQTMKTDFQNLNQSLTAAQSSQSSGNPDQVTISQAALQKAAAAVQNDIFSLLNSAGGASNATTGSSSASGTNASPLQTLSQDIVSLQTAIQSGKQGQIQSAENTLGTELSGIQKGHHHHHHHGAASAISLNSTNSGSTASNSTGTTNAAIGALLSTQA